MDGGHGGSGRRRPSALPARGEMLVAGGDPPARAHQVMLGAASGAQKVRVVVIRTPPGGGSRCGLV